MSTAKQISEIIGLRVDEPDRLDEAYDMYMLATFKLANLVARKLDDSNRVDEIRKVQDFYFTQIVECIENIKINN